VRLHKVKTLGLLSLPLMAIALAVVLLSGGIFSSEKTEANAGVPEMSFVLQSGSTDCAPTAKPLKCSVPTGTTFDLGVSVNAFPPDPDGPPVGTPCVTGCAVAGYSAIGSDVSWPAAIVYKKRANNIEVPWPERGNTSVANVIISPTNVQHGDLSTGSGVVPSTFKGVVVSLRFNCTSTASTGNVILLNPATALNPGGGALADNAATVFPQADSITINCVAAPTATPTNTATNTPTPTNTPTQVPIPRMQKCIPANAVSTACGTLQNLFLTRQGTKIPPSRCVDGTNGATLVERIHIPIGGNDPKNPSQPREIGGFSFQVKYDPLKVCISLARGPGWTSNGQICTIEDSVSAPTLQGVARINCVTLGKSTLVDTDNPVNRILAIITAKPQPEAYSQIKANQDNGQAVQLNDEACKLTDLQGHAIEVFSCEDADVTIRFLEGDVEPDCQVNTLDTQSIAFRWGASKGSLVFNDRFNLEPSGTQADQDIDVNDLQFVYGRFGSTCAAPHPAQNPVNPKA